MRPSEERIDLQPARPPGSDEAYRPFIAVSLGLAILLGFALGLHVAVSRLLGGVSATRTADYVTAHGQVQLLGFAGLYVMGMSLRLLPRFSGAKVKYAFLMPAVLGLIAGALALRALVLPLASGALHDVVLLAVSLGLLGGSGAFFAIITFTVAARPRALDVSAATFVCGATFHLVSAALALALAVDAVADGARGPSYLGHQALLQLQLTGFLCCFILGVSLRAVPVMVGLDRPGGAPGFLLLTGLCASALLLSAALLYTDRVASSAGAARLAGASLVAMGASFLALSWQTGALRSLTNRLRPASQPHLWLVRSAFAWLTVAGAIAMYYGVMGVIDAELPSPFAFDALRHALGLGVVTTIICGMSLMIVPEFAVQRQRTDQKRLAFFLFGMLNTATLLRVMPVLAGASWSGDQRDLSIAAAGSLAEVALIVFAVSLLRLFGRR